MHGKALIFSRGGVSQNGPRGPQRSYGVSPLFFPQRGILNDFYLPSSRELPEHGLQAQVMVFDFGFAIPAQTVAPMDSQFFQVALASNFLATTATGVSDVPPSQNVTVVAGGVNLYASALSGVQVDPAFLVTIQQTHAGNTWQWMNKGVSNREFLGTSRDPMPLRSPVLIPAGDTIGCTIQNMANTSLRVQVVLVGGSF